MNFIQNNHLKKMNILLQILFKYNNLAKINKIFIINKKYYAINYVMIDQST
jgi:hypothetical protein